MSGTEWRAIMSNPAETRRESLREVIHGIEVHH
jgi:hypothetical protein